MLPTIILLSACAQINLNVLRDSLPRLDGEAALAELSQPAIVERDAQGVPTIKAHSLTDAARAQGFVHAQDRLFQIDGLRRLAAGELAELAGAALVSMDQRYRPLGLRKAADELFAALPEDQRELLEAYAQGVNAAIADAVALPPEYVLLQMKPRRWTPQDSLLVMYVMFDMLHFDARFEANHGMAKDILGDELFEFLTPAVTRFDAPLIEGADAQHEAKPPQVPGPDIVNLRKQSAMSWDLQLEEGPAAGSNNWAVAGARSSHGRAILANDPHLHITVPSIWYRARLQWQGNDLTGISLPGVPGIVVGSNGKVAWGVTNTMGDFQDLIVIEVDPEDSSRYRVADGFEEFGEVKEQIAVRGGESVELVLRTTRWGVVTAQDWRGRPLVLKWSALDPNMVNLNILNMWQATNVEEALKIGRSWWGPSQNLLVADDAGRIGWIVTGYLPRRVGFDGKTPVSWADGKARWDGALPESLRPTLIDPEAGFLFTANNRTVHPQWARQIGKMYDIGLRASRIKQMLEERDRFSEADLQTMQLDTRSLAHDFYRDLIFEVCAAHSEPARLGGRAGGEEDHATTALQQARQLAQAWNGTAHADQAAYRLLRLYRRALHDTLMQAILAPLHVHNPNYVLFWMMQEEPLRQILEQRPMHLLPQPYEDWEDFLAQQLVETVKRMDEEAPRNADGSLATWGQVNRTAIQHPMTTGLPALARFLNMPEDEASGDQFTVRVATRLFSASMRMVVSPGREQDGYFHMPCGQSGHPLSPNYRDGHAAWVNGLPTPFLPGETVHTLTLKPSDR